MRQTLRASIMVMALCGSAFAGDMLTPPVAPPSSPATQEAITDGEIDTGATAPAEDGDVQNGAAVTLMQVVLNLLALS